MIYIGTSKGEMIASNDWKALMVTIRASVPGIRTP